MADVLTALGAALALVLGFFTLLGLAVRWILLPYLKEHLIDPVKQTNRQVTVNHHTSKEPTVLDRLDDVKTELQTELRAMARAYDGHLEWSQHEVDRIWEALNQRKRP